MAQDTRLRRIERRQTQIEVLVNAETARSVWWPSLSGRFSLPLGHASVASSPEPTTCRSSRGVCRCNIIRRVPFLTDGKAYLDLITFLVCLTKAGPSTRNLMRRMRNRKKRYGSPLVHSVIPGQAHNSRIMYYNCIEPCTAGRAPKVQLALAPSPCSSRHRPRVSALDLNRSAKIPTSASISCPALEYHDLSPSTSPRLPLYVHTTFTPPSSDDINK